MADVKKVGADFLMDNGLLFRINQTVLHPFGLALEVICWESEEEQQKEIKKIESFIKIIEDAYRFESAMCEDEKDLIVASLKELIEIKKQKVRFGGVWDYREDAEGMAYEDKTFEHGKAKFDKFMDEFGKAKYEERKKELGYFIQGEE